MARKPDEKTVALPIQNRLGPEAHHSTPYLTVIAGEDIGRMVELKGERVVIGRAPELHVVIDDDSVSRHHAEIVRDPNGLVVRDLQSTNGILVNGAPTELHRLADGDKLQVGNHTILRFSYQDALDESFQKELYESATRDALTGAYNKRHLQQQLKAEFAYCVRHKRKLSFLLLDLDHFKRTNDIYGHQAGDYVLKATADRIRAVLRKEDIFFRYGGEEFGVILRGVGAERAHAVAERLCRALEAHRFDYEGQTIPVTTSIGVGTKDSAAIATPDELIAIADTRLYRAKRAGRNQVVSRLSRSR